jgi:hypothetical protein
VGPETLTVGQVLLIGAAAMLVIVLRIALSATGIWPSVRGAPGADGSGGSGWFGACDDRGDGGGGDGGGD